MAIRGFVSDSLIPEPVRGGCGGCVFLLAFMFCLLIIPVLCVVSCTGTAGGCVLMLERMRSDGPEALGETGPEQDERRGLEAPQPAESGKVDSDAADSPEKEPADLLPPEEPDSAEETPPVRPEPSPWRPGMRTWTDSSGKFTVEAIFVSATMGIVKLRKPDGKILEIPMERLSEPDQQWLRARGRR